MNTFWAGTIIGACCSTLLFTVLMFTTVEQNNRLRQEIKELSVKVEEHEKIMRAYEFYNWQYSLKMEKD